jgi:hypothetical protein
MSKMSTKGLCEVYDNDNEKKKKKKKDGGGGIIIETLALPAWKNSLAKASSFWMNKDTNLKQSANVLRSDTFSIMQRNQSTVNTTM